EKKLTGFSAIAVTLFVTLILAVGGIAESINQTALPPAQPAAVGTAARNVPEIKQPLPFGQGEVMKFEVKLSRFPIFASVGEMTFTVFEEKIGPEKPGKANPEKVTVDKPVTGQSKITDETKTKTEKPEQVDSIRIHAEAVSKGALVSL